MGNNLTGQTIASTYEQLVQISGSILTDGTGSDITSLDISASYATTASYALNAGVTVDTGSLMVTGSATNNVLTFTKGDGSTFNLTVDTGSAVTVDTGSLLVTASISDATITFTKGDASTFDITVNNVVNADSASVATTASYALIANTANSATTATSASHALNADNSISSSYALTASYAENAGTTVDTGSLMVTGSVAGNVLRFTKGDASTFNLTVDTGSAGTTPNLQEVTTVGATTSASISITDGGNLTVDNLNGNAELIVTSDGSNTYNSTIRLGGGSGYAGSGFNISMLPGDIASLASDGGLIKLENNTLVTGDVTVSGSTNAVVYVEANTQPSLQLNIDDNSYDVELFNSYGNVGLISNQNDPGLANKAATTYPIYYYAGLNNADNAYTNLQVNGADIIKLVKGGAQVTGSLNISGGASGSFSGSFQGDGSGLTGVVASAFPFTGSAQITGSLIITGSQNMLSTNPLTGNRIVDIQLGNNATLNVPQRFVIRSYNPNNRTTSVSNANMVWGGDGNITLSGFNTVGLGIGTVNSNAYNSAILATNLLTNTIGDTNTSIIAGTNNCTVVQLQRGAVIGTENSYGQGVNTAVIGGRNHWMYDLDGSAQVNRSVILGGTGITASLSDAVYVPTLVVSGSLQGYKNNPINISGSVINITGSTNITGSLTVNGSTPIFGTPTFQEVTVAGASTNQTISITDSTTSTTTILGTGNAITHNSIDGTTQMAFDFADSSAMNYGGMVFDPATAVVSLYSDGGLVKIDTNAQVTGSVSISTVMNLAPQDPLPAGVLGDIAVSGSSGAANVYFYDGTAWTAMI